MRKTDSLTELPESLFEEVSAHITNEVLQNLVSAFQSRRNNMSQERLPDKINMVTKKIGIDSASYSQLPYALQMNWNLILTGLTKDPGMIFYLPNAIAQDEVYVPHFNALKKIALLHALLLNRSDLQKKLLENEPGREKILSDFRRVLPKTEKIQDFLRSSLEKTKRNFQKNSP